MTRAQRKSTASQAVRQPVSQEIQEQNTKNSQKPKQQVAHAHAALKAKRAAQRGQSILDNVTDSAVRDVLLMQDTQLVQLRDEVKALRECQNELKQLILSLQSKQSSAGTGVQGDMHATNAGGVQQKQTWAQRVSPNAGIIQHNAPPPQASTQQQHYDAQIRGFTRTIRIARREGQFTDRELNLLLAADKGKGKIEGISVRRVQGASAAIVTCKDELHRQQVYRQLKRNRKGIKVAVAVQMWLSHLQRDNKQTVYSWATSVGKERVVAYDWGDRILLNKVTTGQYSKEDRWVVDLRATGPKTTQMLQSLQQKWGLKPMATNKDITMTKRDRQQRENVEGPQLYRPLPSPAKKRQNTKKGKEADVEVRQFTAQAKPKQVLRFDKSSKAPALATATTDNPFSLLLDTTGITTSEAGPDSPRQESDNVAGPSNTAETATPTPTALQPLEEQPTTTTPDADMAPHDS